MIAPGPRVICDDCGGLCHIAVVPGRRCTYVYEPWHADLEQRAWYAIDYAEWCQFADETAQAICYYCNNDGHQFHITHDPAEIALAALVWADKRGQ